MAKSNGEQSSDFVRSPAETMFAERFDNLIERILQQNPNYTLEKITRSLEAKGVRKGVSGSSLSGCRHGHRLPAEKDRVGQGPGAQLSAWKVGQAWSGGNSGMRTSDSA